MSPQSFSYEAMGAQWKVTIWDLLEEKVLQDLRKEISAEAETFEATYSRFRPSSLIRRLADEVGTVKVPEELVTMLRLYERLYNASERKFTPLLGGTLSDLGYDEAYTLIPREKIRNVPELPEALRIVGDDEIELLQPVLLDLGGVGKGFFVDKVASFLRVRGYRHFLVDGSGDIFYESEGIPISAGLEHPLDPKKVIGTVELTRGALCASGGNRRKWGAYHHIIDPESLSSPQDILATWTIAESAVVADALATALFLVEPERLAEFSFECCLMNQEHRVRRSSGFIAELF